MTLERGGGGGGGGHQSSSAVAASWGGVARLLAGMARVPGAEEVIAVCVQHALDVLSEATRTGAGVGVVNGGGGSGGGTSSPSFKSSSGVGGNSNSTAAAAAAADPAATIAVPLLFPERFSLIRALGVALSCLVGPGAEPSALLKTPAGTYAPSLSSNHPEVMITCSSLSRLSHLSTTNCPYVKIPAFVYKSSTFINIQNVASTHIAAKHTQ